MRASPHGDDHARRGAGGCEGGELARGQGVAVAVRQPLAGTLRPV